MGNEIKISDEVDELSIEFNRIEIELNKLSPQLNNETIDLINALRSNSRNMISFVFDCFNTLKERFDNAQKEKDELEALLNDSVEVTREAARALTEERTQNEQYYDDLCFLFIYKPRAALETIIKRVERNRKINSSDGFENWQWEYRFPLLLRISMAFKFVFGSTKI